MNKYEQLEEATKNWKDGDCKNMRLYSLPNFEVYEKGLIEVFIPPIKQELGCQYKTTSGDVVIYYYPESGEFVKIDIRQRLFPFMKPKVTFSGTRVVMKIIKSLRMVITDDNLLELIIPKDGPSKLRSLVRVAYGSNYAQAIRK